MQSISVLNLILLFAFAFLAGLIDSIAGGGGLIQLPAVMTFLPGFSVVQQLAVNKLSSSMGTLAAALQFSHRKLVRWREILPVACVALFASIGGAETALHMPNGWMKPLVVGLLGAVILYTYLKKDLGSTVQPSHFSPKSQKILSLAAGVVIGFYDGFFGPGVGSFLILVFITLFGWDFLHATASAKIVNLATNAGALILFFSSGMVHVRIGLCMAVFNILGSVCGVRLAVLKGSRFIRVLFLCVTCGLFIKQLIGLF